MGIAIGSRAAAEPLVRFFSTARTNGRAVSLRDYRKASVEEEKKNSPIQASSTQYSFHISGNRGYDSNRVCCFCWKGIIVQIKCNLLNLQMFFFFYISRTKVHFYK